MTQSKKPSKEDLLKTLKKLEKNPNDTVRILGEVGITVFGAGASAVAAAAIGVTSSIPVITAVTGIVLVGATPIGWVATAAVAGGAAAWSLAQALKHGSKTEATRAWLINDLQHKIKDIDAKETASKITAKDLSDFYGLLRKALEADLMSKEDTQRLLEAIGNNTMSLSEAYQLIKDIVIGI